jgi:hypothetical protein
MNLKDQSEILVLNAPDSFEPEVSRLRGVKVRRSLSGVSQIAFALAFVTRQKEVDALAKPLAKVALEEALHHDLIVFPVVDDHLLLEPAAFHEPKPLVERLRGRVGRSHLNHDLSVPR